MWRSTDYGSIWVPLFDDQPTGSIGAIAVAPSDPNVIYVGSGAGIIRPDLSTGDGMYKSTDAGETWTHLGLRDSQMIADVEVDPANPDRLFVAALGHPYGPNEERGIFRSTDGGRTFEKVLYRDEYTSGNDVLIDPVELARSSTPRCGSSSRVSVRARSSAAPATASSSRPTAATTWRPLTERTARRDRGQPRARAEQSTTAVCDGRRHAAAPPAEPARDATAEPPVSSASTGRPTPVSTGRRSTCPQVQWDAATPHVDTRPLARIGGGDLPTITVDPTNENVIYSATVVMWRSDDGGVHWSAVRGAYGGDDYQTDLDQPE